METPNLPSIRVLRPALNNDRIVGQKRPLKPKHVWAIRVRLELAENHRDLALFDLVIDSKLRGCDLVKMKVIHVMASGSGLGWQDPAQHPTPMSHMSDQNSG
jgi:hypothetical protein